MNQEFPIRNQVNRHHRAAAVSQTDERSLNRRLILAAFMALALVFLALRSANANGIPVEVYLDFAPFKSTWEPATSARGVAVVASNDEQVRVMAQSLPAPPPHAVYYAWLEKVDGGYLPVGELEYRPDGTASITGNMPDLPYSENFSWVVVSIEDPFAIGEKPSTEIALAGRLPNPVAMPRSLDELPELLPITGGSTVNPEVISNNQSSNHLLLGLSVLIVASVALWTWHIRRDSRRRIPVLKLAPGRRHRSEE